MTIHHRIDAPLWFALTAAVLLAGSVGCFSYAGMQLNTDRATVRHETDGTSSMLRSPVAFERWIPGPAPLARSQVGPLAESTVGDTIVAAEGSR